MITNYWERLDRIIQWSEMSINHFAHQIGLLRSENLYQIKRGNNGISRKLAGMIVARFPQISISWLLTGNGEMLVTQPNLTSVVEFYEADAEGQIADIHKLASSSTFTLPVGVESDFAMVYRGMAMGERVPTNSVVVLKKIGIEGVVFGGEYLIHTEHLSTLRIVRKGGERGEVLRLEATLNDRFDDIEIKPEEIIGCYRVVAKVIITAN